MTVLARVLFLLVTLALPARASVDPAGQLAEEVKIDVPPFHDITPEIALRYQSDGGNGFAGVGWRLDLGRTITRVSATGGIPRWDASDRYLLDGQDLVPCASGSTSPGCSTAVTAFGSSAGFLTTKVESYERLRQDATGWTLWRRDGTQLVLASVDGGRTYRIASVKDTHGNVVRHTWWCDEACYPDTITYADRPGFPGALIRFVREDRPDKLSAGNGNGFTRTNHRLHAIEVRMHGQLLRAYQLGYTHSLANGASIASTIQQFGRDAIVSAAGAYSAGVTPALPAFAMTTPSMLSAGSAGTALIANNNLTAITDARVPFASRFAGDPILYHLAYTIDNDGEHPRPHGQAIGDFNADGRVDWLKWSVRTKDCTSIELNTIVMTKASFAPTVRSTLIGVGPYTPVPPNGLPAPQCALQFHVADVNGDRREDLLLVAGGSVTQLISMGSGHFTAGSVHPWSSAKDQRCTVADFDGDSVIDLACTSVVANAVQLQIARSQGQGSWSITTDALSGLGVAAMASHRLEAGDFSGDGLADLTIATQAGTTWNLLAGKSDGLGHVTWQSQATTWPATTAGQLASQDVDGDGKADAIIISNGNVYTALSAKGNTTRFRNPMVIGGWSGQKLGDHDGDGRVDLLDPARQRWALGRGDGTFAPPTSSDVAMTSCDSSLDEVEIHATDLNGDSRSDILCAFDNGQVHLYDRMSGVLPGGPSHAWIQADTSGDGIADLVYVTPLAPRGYRITTVDTETQQRAVYDVTAVANTQVQTKLDEPDTFRFMAMDVGSASGAPDGKADLVLVDAFQGTLRIYTFMSHGDGTFTAHLAEPGTFAASDLEGWQPGQIDGDGRGDLIHPWLTGSGIAVDSLRSRGNGQWDVISTPAYFPGVNLTTPGLIVVDLSGDGLSDIVHAQCCNSASGGSVLRSLLRSTGGTFSERTLVNPAYFRDLRRLKLADVNGDGLADLVHVTTTGPTISLQAYASDGNGDFQYRQYVATWTSTGPHDANLLEDTSLVRFLDINGDRRTDLVHVSTYVDAAGQLRTAILTAQAPITDAPTPAWPTQLTSGLAFGAYAHDPWRWQPWIEPISGDRGLLYIAPTAVQAYVFHAAPDRASKIANGHGAIKNIGYSILWGARTYLPEGSLPRVVSSVETRDEAHTPVVSETTTYAYGEARYSIALRELGFGWMQRTDASSRELTFSTIDDQCGTRPTRVMHLAPDHSMHAYSVYSYVAPGVAPYTCDRQVTDDYECAGPSCRFARSEALTLDVYGNRVVTAISADRAVASLIYAPTAQLVALNAAAYLIDRPMYDARFDVMPGGNQLRSMTTFAYDGRAVIDGPGVAGNVTTIARHDGVAPRETRFTFDATGQLLTVTDPRQQVESVEYDADYGLTPARICLGATCSQYAIDPTSRLVTSSTDANGAVTTSTHDGYGRIRKVTRPGGGTHETHYLGTGVFTGPMAQRQRTRTEMSDGSPTDGVLWSETFHDGLDRTMRTLHEGGATIDTRYADASSRPESVSVTYAAGGQPAGWTGYSYDAAGRLTHTELPDGASRSVEHLLGKTIERDETGQPVTTWRDGHGQIWQRDDHVGASVLSTRYELDGAGRVRKMTDALGHVVSIDFDLSGRQIATTDPDRGTTRFAYLENDLLASSTDAAGQTLRYTYDGAGRMIEREDLDPNGRTMRTATWLWDRDAAGMPSGSSKGRLVAMSDKQAATSLETTYVYDADGNVVTTTRCIDRECMPMQQSFDAAGRLASLTYPDASGSPDEKVVHTYDAAGNASSVGGYATAIGHTLDGRLATLTLGNGVTSTLTYDPARRWMSTTVTEMAGRTVHAASYTHDSAGRITFLEEQNANRSELGFTYDELGRLVDVTSSDPSRGESFVYDPIGRLRWSTLTGDVHYGDKAHAHAPTLTDRGFERSYDLLGNVNRMLDPSGRLLRLAWTADGRLDSTTDSNTGETTTLAYDPDGTRVKKRGTAGTTMYFGPHVERINGQLVKYYFLGDRLLARRDSKQLGYYTLDLTRSTRVITDDGGNAINRYDYSAFGRVLTANESIAQDHEHAGRQRDDESALTFLNARYYDPELAHFVSADTVIPDVHDPQSFHRYSYVQQDPVNHWDPTGHMRSSVEYLKELRGRGGIDAMLARAGFLCGSGNICFNVPIEMRAELETEARWARMLARAAFARDNYQLAIRMNDGSQPRPSHRTNDSATLATKALAEKVEPTAFTDYGLVVVNPKWKGIPFLTPAQLQFEADMKALVDAKAGEPIFGLESVAISIEKDHGTIGPHPAAMVKANAWWSIFNDLGEGLFPTPSETPTSIPRERRAPIESRPIPNNRPITPNRPLPRMPRGGK
jgi:RHS repeat-associated protein